MSFEFDLFRDLGTRENLWVRKHPSSLRRSGLSAFGFKSSAERGNWRCSILASTANSGPAISSS
jgi:hypothetical protein